jgi:nucleoside-diphosphate-sugar epimerase
MDISLIREDTGYEPEYDVESGVADYVEWLQLNPQ